METVEAITLDVGGTLIEPWPSVGHIYAEVAARHGVQAEPEELTRRFVQVWQAQDAFQYTRADWAAVVDTTFEGLVTQLPSQTFFGELYSHFAKAECWYVYEDVIPTLTALRQQAACKVSKRQPTRAGKPRVAYPAVKHLLFHIFAL